MTVAGCHLTGGRGTQYIWERPDDAMFSSTTNSKPSDEAHAAKDGRGILITSAAMEQLSQLCSKQDGEYVLRVGVRSGGCSGMSYTMDFVPASDTKKDDEAYDYISPSGSRFRVICDPKSLLYIYGMQLDFSTALIGGGFNFTNPNATQTCGCGSSFAV